MLILQGAQWCAYQKMAHVEVGESLEVQQAHWAGVQAPAQHPPPAAWSTTTKGPTAGIACIQGTGQAPAG